MDLEAISQSEVNSNFSNFCVIRRVNVRNVVHFILNMCQDNKQNLRLF